MRKYIYPQDLTARATMWLWQLNDLAAIGALCLAGVFCAASLELRRRCCARRDMRS